MKSPKSRYLFSVVLMGLVASAAWSTHQRHQLKSAVVAVQQQTSECQRLIDEVLWLREQPNQAGASEVQLHEIAAVIEASADGATIDRKQLVRIWPESSRRIGETPYRQVPTQVLIRAASLEQISRFLVDIEHHAMGLRVTSLRITVPYDQQSGDLWTLEATISYLIYQPTTGHI